MSKSSMIFHGEWWVPAEMDPDNQGLFPMVHKGHEARHTGTLTYYEDDVSTLEFYHVPSHFQAKLYWNNSVIWGADANGFIYTLFNVTKRQGINKAGFTATVFEVGLVLLGEHVLSLKEARYDHCVVKFPYLRNWAFRDHLIQNFEDGHWAQIVIDASKYKTIHEVQLGDGFKWILYDKFVLSRSKYDLNLNQLTEFKICAEEAVSIESFLKHIKEFSQFLSVALYCEQSPAEISLYRKGQIRSTQLPS